jgi:hypothetical protein
MKLDFGDVVFDITARVKCATQLRIVWHVGAPFDTTDADRIIKPPPYAVPTERKDLIMDLMADKQVPLSVEWTDEVGNVVTAPVGATITYTVDDPTIINLTDNGDGTATAAAVGPPGSATVHVEAVNGTTTLTGDLAIVVVAGLAERVNIVAGEPVEVTPDTP